MPVVLFDRFYDGESLHDLDRDIYESLSGEFNPKMEDIPQDENGFPLGSFRVTVEWTNDE